jgi:hypothetical protein
VVQIINSRVHLDNVAQDLVSVELLVMKFTVVKAANLNMGHAMELSLLVL